ncbi:unnamed protein product [Peronospora effusa]|uniref:BRCT domain-containing protein n=1 Tax=Peronospora effusa TaxID=542832 RepID=A0A3R7XC39_9STRA|nr:hypothetical protein DD237_007440 [Peronospora effusa]CAI5701792.1 unnamed protein product [Peronospora effusa]
MPPLFHELRFYMSRMLSTEEKAELTQLIESNGGVVSITPAGAMQLVNNETLDARHPEWISTDFVKQSIAFQSRQNPLQYSGNIFTIEKKNQDAKRQGRRKYTVIDDARMMHFAKLRGWRSMQPLAESVWRRAEKEKVTFHSAQSMHEHFRKQLQRKTLIEQRSIMTKAAALTREWMLEQEGAAQEEKVTEEMQSDLNSTGIQNVATQESMTSTHASRHTLIAAGCNSRSMTYDALQFEGRGEKKCSQRDMRTRSRKPTSPLRIFQSLQKSEELSGGITSPTLAASPTRPPPAMPVVPAALEVPIVQATSEDLETGDQSAERKQQKRKRITPSSEAAISGESSLLRQGTEGSDADSVESKTGRNNGVFFHSTWTELARDYAKRRKLQRFFEPSLVPAPAEAQASSIGLAVTHPIDVGVSTAAQVEEGSQQVKTVEHATDKDTDQIICDLQFRTHQDMLTVVHALYYCSGDAKVAENFLKGAMPLSMWSPEDDLLLASLVAEDGIDRLAVDAAVARGDFVSMRMPRDTDAILKRVAFLR